ncbi:hypothetical protein ACQ4W7_02715 [Janthinobacterium sp. MDT1-19]
MCLTRFRRDALKFERISTGVAAKATNFVGLVSIGIVPGFPRSGLDAGGTVHDGICGCTADQDVSKRARITGAGCNVS